MLFEGTRFAGLENNILQDIKKKKRKSSEGKERSDDQPPNKDVAHKRKRLASSQLKAETDKRTRLEENGKVKKTGKVASLLGESTSTTSDVSTGEEVDNEFNNNRTIYLQGLPFTASEDEIRKFFVDNHCSDIESIRLPRWHDSGKLRGYGHVVFSTNETAQKALELDGHYIQNRYINIDRPKTPRMHAASATSAASSSGSNSNGVEAPPPGCRTVFIKNLPYTTTEEEMRQCFMLYGPIKTVRLAVWNHTGKLKGFGYIEFKRDDSAATAVKKSGSVEVQGRKTLVDFETGAPKGSFKPLNNKSSQQK